MSSGVRRNSPDPVCARVPLHSTSRQLTWTAQDRLSTARSIAAHCLPRHSAITCSAHRLPRRRRSTSSSGANRDLSPDRPDQHRPPRQSRPMSSIGITYRANQDRCPPRRTNQEPTPDDARELPIGLIVGSGKPGHYSSDRPLSDVPLPTLEFLRVHPRASIAAATLLPTSTTSSPSTTVCLQSPFTLVAALDTVPITSTTVRQVYKQ